MATKVTLTVTYEAIGWTPDMLKKATKAVADLNLPQHRQWGGEGINWWLKGIAFAESYQPDRSSESGDGNPEDEGSET